MTSLPNLALESSKNRYVYSPAGLASTDSGVTPSFKVDKEVHKVLVAAVEAMGKKGLETLDQDTLTWLVFSVLKPELLRRLKQTDQAHPKELVDALISACEPPKRKMNPADLSRIIPCTEAVYRVFDQVLTVGEKVVDGKVVDRKIGWEALTGLLFLNPTEKVQSVILRFGSSNVGSNVLLLTTTAKQLAGVVSRKLVKHPMQTLGFVEMTSPEFVKHSPKLIGQAGALNSLIRHLSGDATPSALIVGLAGVGKTALVTGLAQRIVNNDHIPPWLAKSSIWLVPASVFSSGIQKVGDFEKRVKKLLEAAKSPPDRRADDGVTIIFVDEIHSLAGIKAPQTNISLLDLLKPALASGELHLIGATTTDESKALRKDEAFMRRMTVVEISPTTNSETVDILRSLAERLANHLKIDRVADRAVLEEVVRFSERYSGIALPGAAVKIFQAASSLLETMPNEVETRFHSLVLMALKQMVLLDIPARLDPADYETSELDSHLRVVSGKARQETDALDRMLGPEGYAEKQHWGADDGLPLDVFPDDSIVGLATYRAFRIFEILIDDHKNDIAGNEKASFRELYRKIMEISTDAYDIAGELSRIFAKPNYGNTVLKRYFMQLQMTRALQPHHSSSLTLINSNELVDRLRVISAETIKNGVVDGASLILEVATAIKENVSKHHADYFGALSLAFSALGEALAKTVGAISVASLQAILSGGNPAGIVAGLLQMLLSCVREFGIGVVKMTLGQLKNKKMHGALIDLMKSEGNILFHHLVDELGQDSTVGQIARLIIQGVMRLGSSGTELEMLGVFLPPMKISSRILANVGYQDYGVEVDRVITTSAEAAMVRFEKVLSRELVGQPILVHEVTARLRIASSGYRRGSGPIAIFVVPGPTGTGKTFLAKLIAEHYFGSRRLLVHLNGGDYSNPEMGPAKLLGSSAGYIGFGADTPLMPLSRRRSQVLLIDEADKMAPHVWRIFLGAFEEGKIELASGKVIDISGCVVVLTTNNGQERFLAEGPTLFPHSRYSPTVAELAELQRLSKAHSPKMPNARLKEYWKHPGGYVDRVHLDDESSHIKSVKERLLALKVALNLDANRDPDDDKAKESPLYVSMKTIWTNEYCPRFDARDRDIALSLLGVQGIAQTHHANANPSIAEPSVVEHGSIRIPVLPDLANGLREALTALNSNRSGSFSREFLGRCDIVPALKLEQDALSRIVHLEFDRWSRAVDESMRLHILPPDSHLLKRLAKKILQLLGEKAGDEGARPIRSKIELLLGEALARAKLKGDVADGEDVYLVESLDGKGYQFLSAGFVGQINRRTELSEHGVPSESHSRLKKIAFGVAAVAIVLLAGPAGAGAGAAAGGAVLTSRRKSKRDEGYYGEEERRHIERAQQLLQNQSRWEAIASMSRGSDFE